MLLATLVQSSLPPLCYLEDISGLRLILVGFQIKELAAGREQKLEVKEQPSELQHKLDIK